MCVHLVKAWIFKMNLRAGNLTRRFVKRQWIELAVVKYFVYPLFSRYRIFHRFFKYFIVEVLLWSGTSKWNKLERIRPDSWRLISRSIETPSGEKKDFQSAKIYRTPSGYRFYLGTKTRDSRKYRGENLSLVVSLAEVYYPGKNFELNAKSYFYLSLWKVGWGKNMPSTAKDRWRRPQWELILKEAKIKWLILKKMILMLYSRVVDRSFGNSSSPFRMQRGIENLQSKVGEGEKVGNR